MSTLPACPKLHYTHPLVVASLFKDITWSNEDYVLEPCYGSGNMYDLIPVERKEWAEIEKGRNFFTQPFKDKQFTKVVLNPPYSSNHIKGDPRRKILTYPFIFKALEVCSDEVWVLLNNNMLNSLTPNRLQKIKDAGYGLTFMRILNIPLWSGRYYWLCFKRGADWLISFTNAIELPPNVCECGSVLKGDLTAHRQTQKHFVNLVKKNKL
jgi:hypothetical protein